MITSKRFYLLMFFVLITGIGITALLSPLISMIANWLVSLEWYQAGIGFLVVGLAGVFILLRDV